MYLDKPLKEHNLLQAIARTNRVSPLKQFGLIVDYIGVTNNLDEALASYRKEDVANALRDLDELEDKLRDAHAEVLPYMRKVREKDSRPEHAKREYQRLVQELATEGECTATR
jgi:type I restriction enzyme R subunit